ncbi:hypothetical protein [Allonocardiopsis opalescens]|uniref:Uncharacterized protein n=1 Tax=Allonocardiopsis opalescens TaxID=1144618 RepID=A0A2T0PZQ6_9ACTN|nr:hypothetical protein [Allonocardiopsis opalescens]PRX97018.1 hypothetical protein CLV72_10654 [Allonocardiopsis opalescens]
MDDDIRDVLLRHVADAPENPDRLGQVQHRVRRAARRRVAVAVSAGAAVLVVGVGVPVGMEVLRAPEQAASSALGDQDGAGEGGAAAPEAVDEPMAAGAALLPATLPGTGGGPPLPLDPASVLSRELAPSGSAELRFSLGADGREQALAGACAGASGGPLGGTAAYRIEVDGETVAEGDCAGPSTLSPAALDGEGPREVVVTVTAEGADPGDRTEWGVYTAEG